MTDSTSRRHLRLPASDPDLHLSGTLESPGVGPKGLILLLSGSGPQDRDETVAGQKPFARLRSGLSDRGWAVFSWDDRGVDESEGDYLAANPGVLVADVHAVRRALSAELGDLPVVLLGHSQGTLIGARTAHEEPPPAALVLLAGAGRPGRAVLIDQHVRICEAEALPRDWADSVLRLKIEVFDRLARTPADADPADVVDLRADLESIVGEAIEDPEDAQWMVEDFLEWEWRFILQHDPATSLRKVDCPTLVWAGGSDTQVDSEQEVAATRAALESGVCPEVTAEVLPGLNHLFQESASGALGDYEDAGDPFPSPILDRLDAWLTARVTGVD